MAILFLAALMFLQIGMVHAGIQEVVKTTNFMIEFYNPGDTPPAMSYMRIIFNNVQDKEVEKITKWQKEMDDKIQKGGAVLTQKDYDRIAPVIVDYSVKFTGTGVPFFAVEFPRKREGFLVYSPK